MEPPESPIGKADLRATLRRVSRDLRRETPPAPADVAKLEAAARQIRDGGGRPTVAALIDAALASARRLGLVADGPLH
ncbi:hypothetical protein F8B43_3591 [Methylorubrum populi]|uniref:Uncharacterized protein n=1 Tax=Methylorubrum populi TaxID=223967 RepID=A0A833J2U7_9HYPH|nr:hypothetical protein F8B43_3591 [Methylorubrum populi]